mmetsp:Transcript_100243/g.289404  ORF Transcript_100243/g.289404 Transcript_100243/m.289404 type:complete len:352 (+) Transcript_100243:288-1343(+)
MRRVLFVVTSRASAARSPCSIAMRAWPIGRKVGMARKGASAARRMGKDASLSIATWALRSRICGRSRRSLIVATRGRLVAMRLHLFSIAMSASPNGRPGGLQGKSSIVARSKVGLATRSIARKASTTRVRGWVRSAHGAAIRRTSVVFCRPRSRSIAQPVLAIGTRRGRSRRRTSVATRAARFVNRLTALQASSKVGRRTKGIGVALTSRRVARCRSTRPPRSIARRARRIGTGVGMTRRRNFAVATASQSVTVTIASWAWTTRSMVGRLTKWHGAVAISSSVARRLRRSISIAKQALTGGRAAGRQARRSIVVAPRATHSATPLIATSECHKDGVSPSGLSVVRCGAKAV